MPLFYTHPLVRHAALIRGDHIFDVDKGVLPSPLLEKLQRPHDALPHALLFLLRIIDAVPQVFGVILEQVQHGQNLPVVGHQSLPDHLLALHQFAKQLRVRGKVSLTQQGLGSSVQDSF